MANIEVKGEQLNLNLLKYSNAGKPFNGIRRSFQFSYSMSWEGSHNATKLLCHLIFLIDSSVRILREK